MLMLDALDTSSEVIKLLTVENKSLFLYCTPINNAEYAFYLYKDSKVVCKINYSFLNFFKFESLEAGSYYVKVFYKLRNSKKSFSSKKIIINDSINDSISIKDYSLDPKMFDIHVVNNPYIEVVSQETKGFVGYARNDLAPYKIKLPLDWGKNPYNDRNWMFQLQAWRCLDPYLQCDFDITIINKISSIINDWVQFEKKTKDKQTLSWLWYDMSAGLRALKLVFYIIKCKESGKPHGIVDISYLISQHLKHLSNIEELSLGNHGLFQLNGLMALCSIVAKDTEKYKAFARNQMKLLLQNQLGTKGIHTENSPDYHFFSVRAIKKIINSLWWQKDEVAIYFNELLEKSSIGSNWLVDPNNQCVPIGDSSYSKFRAKKKEALLWPHVKFGSNIAAQLDGYAVIRSHFDVNIQDSSFLFFQGAFHSPTHKHSDCLSFIWQEKGQYILIDGGKYGYQNDKYRKYFLSNRSHNTLIVDNLDYSRNRKHLYGSSIIQKPINIQGIWILAAKVNHVSLHYTHTRVVLYEPGHCVYVIDKVDSQKKGLRKIELNWMFSENISVRSINKDGFILNNVKDKISYRVVSDHGDISINKNIGLDTGKSVSGWRSIEYLSVVPTLNMNVELDFIEKTVIISKFILGDDNYEDIVFIEKNSLESKNLELKKLINKLLD